MGTTGLQFSSEGLREACKSCRVSDLGFGVCRAAHLMAVGFTRFKVRIDSEAWRTFAFGEAWHSGSHNKPET